MFENELICQYLYDKLLSYREFFKDLILPKDDITKLIKKAQKYEQILKLLFYSGMDFFVFLEVVRDSKDTIHKFQVEEMNKNENNELYDNRIDIEKYVEPKKEDDLSEIFSLIEGFKMIIYNFNKNMKLIKYSSLIFEKYFEFYYEIDVDKLIILKNIMESIKQFDKSFDCKCNIEEKIHKTELKLIKNGKIKNNEILDYIREDIYYLDKKFNKKIYRPLEFLDGIDISLIRLKEDKNNFLRTWKIINFYAMFESQLDDFLKKTSLLIKEMKNFGYLFKLYNIEQEKNPEKHKERLIKIIKALQNRFIEILPTYNDKECPNFIDEVVELIDLSDKNKVDIKNFLSEIIEKKFSVKIVNDIYFNITEKKNPSKECKEIILKYFTEYKENSDPKSLSELIFNCKNLRDDMISNINKFILKEIIF